MLADRVNVARVCPQVAHLDQTCRVASTAQLVLALGGSKGPRRALSGLAHASTRETTSSRSSRKEKTAPDAKPTQYTLPSLR